MFKQKIFYFCFIVLITTFSNIQAQSQWKKEKYRLINFPNTEYLSAYIKEQKKPNENLTDLQFRLIKLAKTLISENIVSQLKAETHTIIKSNNKNFSQEFIEKINIQTQIELYKTNVLYDFNPKENKACVFVYIKRRELADVYLDLYQKLFRDIKAVSVFINNNNYQNIFDETIKQINNLNKIIYYFSLIKIINSDKDNQKMNTANSELNQSISRLYSNLDDFKRKTSFQLLTQTLKQSFDANARLIELKLVYLNEEPLPNVSIIVNDDPKLIFNSDENGIIKINLNKASLPIQLQHLNIKIYSPWAYDNLFNFNQGLNVPLFNCSVNVLISSFYINETVNNYKPIYNNLKSLLVKNYFEYTDKAAAEFIIDLIVEDLFPTQKDEFIMNNSQLNVEIKNNLGQWINSIKMENIKSGGANILIAEENKIKKINQAINDELLKRIKFN